MCSSFAPPLRAARPLGVAAALLALPVTARADDGFLPHAACLLWQPALVWLHAGSDVLIGLAYVAISAALTYLVYKARQDVPFHSMLLAFGLFIVTCGLTHFVGVYVLFRPAYWFDGAVKVVTAAASVATALALPPLIPRALDLVQAAHVSEARRLSLETANRELEALYAKSRELDELKSRFFANVSHELRTPLTLILGPAGQLARRDDLAPTARRDLEVIERSARLLLGHVNDLLDVAKLDAGRLAVTYVETDLVRLVRNAAGGFEALAREHRVAVALEAPDRLPAEVDADKLARILVNLLANAFTFTPDGGSVRCAVAETGPDTVTIQVRDSGPGVPLAKREVIFERFRQGEEGDDRRFGGTGLGLAIVREFAGLLGGAVTVGDAPEGGASFTITLPRRAPAGTPVAPDPEGTGTLAAPETRPAAAGAAPVETLAAAGAGANGRPHVLVVEDHPDMARFVAEALAPEFRVSVARDGRDGLARARALVPDAIVSDVMMPGMSGERLLEAVRADDLLADVPFVVLTARSQEALQLDLLRKGAQDYLVKPFSVEELRIRVANQVGMRRARRLLQQELETRQQDLETLAHEITQRRREAEDAVRMREEFLSIASHELRTPLTPLQLELQLLRILLARGTLANMDNRRLAEILESAERQSRRFGRLVDELLDVSRITLGRLDLELDDGVDLADLVRSVAGRFTPEFARAATPLVLDAGRPVVSRCDRSRLDQVVSNLLANALRHGRGGAVEVCVRADGDVARLSVGDHGPGIAQEDQVRLFERFTRVGSGRGHGGLGLGLYIVRRIVEAHGGQVGVESAAGAGATFTVTLPMDASPRGEGA